jgi:3-deoxy-D-manno-octulosonate 8-phosphate phosphatase (KDO 8-P phosphatase)
MTENQDNSAFEKGQKTTIETAQIFHNNGGTFLTPAAEIAAKLQDIRAFVFDWDGVFNDGTKNDQGSSPFSEIDSMGVNLLRFGWWTNHNKQMPVMAVISGERNALSFKLTQREHYDAGYFKIRHKIEALEHLMEAHNLQPHQVAFFFDDALDLSIAECCGLRIMIKHEGNPLFRKYVTDRHLADYITANRGGHHAIREATELLLGLATIYDQTIDLRRSYYPDYEQYLAEREQRNSDFFTISQGQIITGNIGQ